MKVALILLIAIVAVGLVLWLTDGRQRSTKPGADNKAPDDKADADDDSACCGMHISCERDSLLASVSPQIEYYDDEELDRFARRPSASYTDEETEEFRDVLLTMRPDDIAGWARSLQLRDITLPQPVRDELLMIVAEARASRGIS